MEQVTNNLTEASLPVNPPPPVRDRIFGVAIVCLGLLLWEIIARPVRFASPPSEFLTLLFQSLLFGGEMRAHFWATLQRFMIGMLLGAVPGILVGRAISRSESRGHRWGPLMTALGLIPVFGLLPAFVIWFGIGELNKSIVASWAMFFPAFFSTSTALRSQSYRRNNRDRESSRERLRDSPCTFVALKQSSIVGMLAVLGAELWAARVGIGVVVAAAGTKFDVPKFHVAMAAATLIMYLSWLALSVAEARANRRCLQKLRDLEAETRNDALDGLR